MSKRKMVLEVEVIQPDADWLWQAHIKQDQYIHGVKVISLSDGDLDEKLSDMRGRTRG